MCTVTWLPTTKGFVLTHNRDEAPARSMPEIVRQGPLLFPRDKKAGGTWFACAQDGRTACLLNGAFVMHRHAPPYRRSRGLMLLDFFEHKHPDDFFRGYDFEGIEPFTFLFFDRSGAGLRACEMRWDEQQVHLRELDTNMPHFWCSCTLYPPERAARREAVFTRWIAAGKQVKTARDAMHLHLHGTVGDPADDYVMQRERVRTVSITQLIVDEKNARMRYRDLLEGKRSERRLTFR